MNTVDIDLKPYHQKFLMHQFVCRKHLKINRDHDIGRFMFAHIEYSHLPKRRRKMENRVKVEIPRSVDIFDSQFAFISQANNVKITDYIESYFMLYFREFIFTCRNFNIPYKDAINTFIEAHDIGHDTINFERLKKNDYRFREKMKNFIISGIKASFNQGIIKFQG